MKPATSNSGSRLSLFGLVFAFLFVSAISWHTWPAEVFNYDLIHDLLNARAWVSGGGFPEHGGVASFGVFNPPGVTFGLLPGYLIFPHEPVLAMRVMTIFLSALTLTGLFLLLDKRFGRGVAVWSCLLYLFSSTGLYFMAEMRPRAHPVFLVWVLYFLDVWINDKKAWALFPVLSILAAGMYWMLEIAPLALGIVLLAVVFRPAFHWKWLAAAVVFSLLLWAPYLKFQVEREFEDLRVLLIEQEPAHNMARLFNQQVKAYGVKRTRGYRAHDIPSYTSLEQNEPAQANNPPPPPEAGKKALSEHFGRMLPAGIPAWGWPLLVLVLMAALEAALRNRGLAAEKGERSQGLLWILLANTFICAGILLVLTKGEAPHIVERRFLWIWVLLCPVIVLGMGRLVQLLVRPPGWRRWTAHSLLALILFVLALNPSLMQKTTSWFKAGLGTVPPGEFSMVVDRVAETIQKNDYPPRIGYDIPFLAWVPAVHAIDDLSSIGIQYDLMLDFRHGIRNLNSGPLSVSRDDSLRIVEHKSEQPWRQSYLDLSGFPPMEVFSRLDSYTILVNPSIAEASGP